MSMTTMIVIMEKRSTSTTTKWPTSAQTLDLLSAYFFSLLNKIDFVFQSPGSVRSHHTQASFHTGGTQKLRNLQRQVVDANIKKVQLSHQIERQRADNDRVAHANLAREASLKVHTIGQGAKPMGYHVRSYSHEQENHSLPRPKSSQSSSKSVHQIIRCKSTYRECGLEHLRGGRGAYQPIGCPSKGFRRTREGALYYYSHEKMI